MFKSEYSFLRYYLQLGIYSVLYFLPLPLVVWPEAFFNGHREIDPYIILFVFALMIIGFAGFVFILKTAPSLTIYPEELVIQHLWIKRKIVRAEVKQIELISSARSGFIIFSQDHLEATIIETIPGEKFSLFEPYYSNMPAIRQALGNWAGLTEQDNNDATTAYIDTPVITKPAEAEPADKFSGSFFRCLTGIAFYEVLLFLIALLFIMERHFDMTSFIAALILMRLFFLLFGRQAHYFLVSGNYLLIKNHLYPWYRKAYPLAAIRDIKFERIPKRSAVLQVTTDHFQSYTYGAGSLRRKTWKALQEKLEGRHIHVRNEAFAEGKL